MLTSQLETWGQELSSIKHFRIGNLKFEKRKYVLEEKMRFSPIITEVETYRHLNLKARLSIFFVTWLQ